MSVREWIDETFEEVVVADGFDDALIGVASGCSRSDTAIYDAAKCIEILMRYGMDAEEAAEYLSFSVTGAYIEGGLLFVCRPQEEEPA